MTWRSKSSAFGRRVLRLKNTKGEWREGGGDVNCGLTDDEFAALTRAMRDADHLFESGATGGGGTRHYLRDCLLPALAKEGLRIVRSADA